jgi:tRNA threonylcarbamoyladenosine biosynthesis protein TsaB
MTFLALDTAMAACSAAVIDGPTKKVLSRAWVNMEKGHAEALAPMVSRVMAEAAVGFADLAGIAVTRGPGTFTGLRIGLSMARGLGLALGIPVTGIDTLTAIAANAAGDPGLLLIAADARRGEVYMALFDGEGRSLVSPALKTVTECCRMLPAGKVTVLGTGADLVIEESRRGDLLRGTVGDLPDAARFGPKSLMAGPAAAMPEPLYLRSPDAKPPAGGMGHAEPLDFRVLTTAEAAILAALHAECFDNPWDAGAFKDLLATPGTSGNLAIVSGEPVAFIVVRTAAGEAEILSLGTRPLARRRGIARRLLDRQLAELRAAGASQCFIEVGQLNEAARALYAGRDFSPAGRRKAYYQQRNGSREDAIIMRRVLA